MMNIYKNIIVSLRLTLAIVFLINTVALTPVYALFDDNGAGSRGPGMANSVTSIADDVDGRFIIIPPVFPQLGIGRNYIYVLVRSLNGLDDGSNVSTTYFGYGSPLKLGKWGAFGLSYHNLKVSNLLSERTISVGYGWNTKLQPFGTDGILSLGSTIKTFTS